MTPIRIQLSRKRGWKMPENTVSVARPSRWGNPFRKGDIVRHPASIFDDWIRNSGAPKAEEMEMLAKVHLRDKNLACWCALCDEHRAGKPLGVVCSACAPCHVDTLLRIANT